MVRVRLMGVREGEIAVGRWKIDWVCGSRQRQLIEEEVLVSHSGVALVDLDLEVHMLSDLHPEEAFLAHSPYAVAVLVPSREHWPYEEEVAAQMVRGLVHCDRW